MNTRSLGCWTGWALLLFGSATYLTALGGRFQFDDYYLVVSNPQLTTPAALWHSLPVGLRPFTKLTLAANVWLHGLRPAGFHLFNVGLHFFSGLLLFQLLRRVPRLAVLHPQVAWFAAALFLLHPAQTEAVTYVSGRSSCLMTACLLAALWLGTRSEQDSGHRRLWQAASVGAFVLAVLSKEVALVYPLLAVIWLRGVEGRSARAIAARVWPHALAAALLFGIVFAHPTYRALVMDAAGRQPLATALYSEARAMTALMGIVVFPWRVNIDHALPVASQASEVLPDLLVLSAVILVAVASRRRTPLLAGGLFWALAALLPTNSLLVRQDLIADRLLYLPMIGFALAAAALLASATEALGHRREAMTTLAVAVICLALATATSRRNLLYHSEVALWTDSVRKAPHNARGHHNLGYAYELDGDLDHASEHYRTAVELAPGNERYRRSLEIVREEGPAKSSP